MKTAHSLSHDKRFAPLICLTVLAIVFFCASSAETAENVSTNIDWLTMCKGLFGGLALFLFGMDQISGALKSALGNQMKILLGRLTKNRFTSVLTGAFITAIVQSSSVTTVLVVGFVSAGMMSMAQSVGVIMGANIGSTITAQIVAFKVEEASLWMIAFGFLAMFTAKQEKIKYYGTMLMGLGLIFFGMGLMGESMYPLRSYQPFLELMSNMDNAFFAILVGAAFTALVQSSSATTAIVITMAGQGLITLEAGIALAFGANIGTCVTAMLATLGKSREAIRAAAVHVIFNVVGVLIWLPLISVLAGWVISISPTHPELEGMSRVAAEVPRQIANAHTVFNVVNTLVFIMFTNQLASLVQFLVPDKVAEDKVLIRPVFLDNSLIKTPALALQSVRLELARIAELATEMLRELGSGILERDWEKLKEVQRKEDQIDILQKEILRYLSAIRTQELTVEEGQEIALSMRAADQLESIGDVIAIDLLNICNRALDENIKPHDTMHHLLGKLDDQIENALVLTTEAIREFDQSAAQKVLRMNVDIDRLLNEALEIQSSSLTESDSDIEQIRLEMTYLDSLKRIHSYLRRIAKDMLPAEITG